ncbi:(3R)-3-hydroxyacyl-CoA dehydrogenase isoform X4 [Cynoglossus semilaevis]|uniref:(3R)-3-hydroxyacyl-CoA dehydrogenase isoform X4 n=1 Tax=Cynoglossus semilaevis TaxID=244447 RepID=UPI000D626C3D|nr:estradiol 17-beta-dehydrogenase 8 isoform X4 [Cynoglossus semilaevis]
MAAPTRLMSRLTLVTGGGSGIGRAVCQRFASEGASVVVADINEESANETLGSLQRDLRGQGHMTAVVDVTSKESVTKLITSIQGSFLVTQAVAQALVSCGSNKGSIITVGSIVGKVGNLGQVNYASSKAGVQGLSRTAAKELSRFGIRCNCVLPGFITTPMTDKVPEKVLTKMQSLVPMGRMGRPAEVADVCAFLASDDSGYVTGASIEVTGGLFMG